MLANTIELLSKYSKDISELDLSKTNSDGILDLFDFNSLIELNCSYNEITNLDLLPNSLIELYCYCTEITNVECIKKSNPKLKIIN